MEKNRATEQVEKRRYWEGQLNSWKASGLTQAEYCREKNLGVRRFLYWKKRIFPERPRATLVELPMRSVLADSSSTISVVVDGRYRVEIDKGFDPETLEKVLRVVCGR